jgi:mRNA interferase RelE/StbE
MEYEIRYSRESLKSLDKIPTKDKENIVLKIHQIPNTESSLDILKMQGIENTFRLRVGKYRVIYEIYRNVLIINVVEIGHRKDIYK